MLTTFQPIRFGWGRREQVEAPLIVVDGHTDLVLSHAPGHTGPELIMSTPILGQGIFLELHSEGEVEHGGSGREVTEGEVTEVLTSFDMPLLRNFIGVNFFPSFTLIRAAEDALSIECD